MGNFLPVHSGIISTKLTIGWHMSNSSTNCFWASQRGWEIICAVQCN